MSRARLRFLMWLLCLAGLFGLAAAAMIVSSQSFAPREWARYAERRASGHNALIEWIGQALGNSLRAVDGYAPQPVPALPNWVGAHPDRSGQMPEGRQIDVVDDASLRDGIEHAQAGDVIRLLPGTYHIAETLNARTAGQPDKPVVVWADQLDGVIIEVTAREAIKVASPSWHFENLVVRGVCNRDKGGLCEHAFHVVGAARGFSLRNSRLEDFDAHIKINGEDGLFPDAGRIKGNSLTNRAPRQTSQPVTSVDLVAASNWVMARNLVADFIKDGGDGISYGIYAKGGGRGNRMEGNLVVCEAALVGRSGQRVGISFGGGGTSPGSCRDQRCVVEQEGGQMVNNLVTRCSDRGIYLNSSANTGLLHNAVVNTAGVTLRYPETSARLRGNLIDGPLSVRDDAVLHDEGENRSQVLASFLGWHPVRSLFVDADALRFEWQGAAPAPVEATTGRATDMCGADAQQLNRPGAFLDVTACLARR